MKLSWSNDHKSKTFTRYPKLAKIENTGEYTRLYVLEPPTDVFVHDLRTPKIENGRPVYKQQKNQQTKKMEDVLDDVWLGNPICLGDREVLLDKSKDTKNCPACAFAKENPDMVYSPKRNFVSHVFQYNTKGQKIPVKPYSGSLVTWKFYNKGFDALLGIHEEFLESAGGLTGVDIVLELDGPPAFQKYNITGSPTCYAKKPEFEAMVEEAKNNGWCEDIPGQAGRKMDRAEIEELLERIKRDHHTLARFENRDSSPMDLTNSTPAAPSMQDNVNSVLSPDAGPSPKAAKASDKAPDMENLLKDMDLDF